MKTRILGLGNPVLSDQAVGLHVVRFLRPLLTAHHLEVDVMESEIAGFALLELAQGWDRLILIDGIHAEGLAPGESMQLTPDDEIPSIRLRAVHEADLPTALALGRELGQVMPGEVKVFGIQVQDEIFFGAQLSPAVQAAVPRVAQQVLDLLLQSSHRIA